MLEFLWFSLRSQGPSSRQRGRPPLISRLFFSFFWCCFPARGLAFCQLITTRGIPAALMIGQPCPLQPAPALYFNTRLYHSGIRQRRKSYRGKALRCSPAVSPRSDLTFIYIVFEFKDDFMPRCTSEGLTMQTAPAGVINIKQRGRNCRPATAGARLFIPGGICSQRVAHQCTERLAGAQAACGLSW